MKCNISFIDLFDLRIVRFFCYPLLGGSNIYFTWIMCDWFVRQASISMEQAGAFGAFTASTVAFAKYFLHEMNKEIDEFKEANLRRRRKDDPKPDGIS